VAGKNDDKSAGPERNEVPATKVSSSEQRAKLDPHVLEDMYPDASALFAPHPIPAITEVSVVVTLDTSVLLLPYDMKNSTSLAALDKAYGQLATAERLFIPARVAREFVNRRDTALGSLISNLNRRKANFPTTDIPVVLAEMPGCKEAIDAVKDAREAHSKGVEQMVKAMKAWRGDDPVTALYAKVFKPPMIIDLPNDSDARKEQAQEHARRFRNLIPPGYKDRQKDDGGIGDFLIWKSVLEIGRRTKKHMAFVTGEEKPDWFSQADGKHVYPRFELVDEYRRASDGHSLRLMNLHELLRELSAPTAVIEDVKLAEKLAEMERQSVIRYLLHGQSGSLAIANSSSRSVTSPVVVPPHSITVVSSSPTGPSGAFDPNFSSGVFGPSGPTGAFVPFGTPGSSASHQIYAGPPLPLVTEEDSSKEVEREPPEAN
jgi:PIN like domain